MLDNFDFSALIPFAMTAGQKPQLSRARIIEAVLIAVITGAVTSALVMYVQQAVIAEQLKTVTKQLERFERRFDRMERDFYVPRADDLDPGAVTAMVDARDE